MIKCKICKKTKPNYSKGMCMSCYIKYYKNQLKEEKIKTNKKRTSILCKTAFFLAKEESKRDEGYTPEFIKDYLNVDCKELDKMIENKK